MSFVFISLFVLLLLFSSSSSSLFNRVNSQFICKGHLFSICTFCLHSKPVRGLPSTYTCNHFSTWSSSLLAGFLSPELSLYILCKIAAFNHSALISVCGSPNVTLAFLTLRYIGNIPTLPIVAILLNSWLPFLHC